MGRPGVLALVLATACSRRSRTPVRPAAPERLTAGQSARARRRRDRGARRRRPGARLRHGRRRRARPDPHVGALVWGATSLKLDTGLGILHGRIIARAPVRRARPVETQPRLPGLVSLTDNARPGARARSARDRLRPPSRRPGDGLLTLPARVARAPLRLDAPLVPEAAGGPVLDADGPPDRHRRARPARRSPWDAVEQRLDEFQPGRAARVRRLEGPVRLRRAAAPAHPRRASRLPRRRRAADRAGPGHPASPARGGR